MGCYGRQAEGIAQRTMLCTGRGNTAYSRHNSITARQGNSPDHSLTLSTGITLHFFITFSRLKERRSGVLALSSPFPPTRLDSRPFRLRICRCGSWMAATDVGERVSSRHNPGPVQKSTSSTVGWSKNSVRSGLFRPLSADR